MTASLTTLLSHYHGERLKGPNDLVVSSDGLIFFVGQGMTGLHDPTGRLYRIHPDGRIDRVLSNGQLPNRLVPSPDKYLISIHFMLNH